MIDFIAELSISYLLGYTTGLLLCVNYWINKNKDKP